MENRITSLFGIRYPIVAGGMIWCSGWRLAAAVSEAGGLGLIGSGSMTPDLLREHIRKCRAATCKPFGVNVPLMYRYAEEIMGVIMEERVPAVFTSAGSPKTWTARLHEAGCKVAHVISSTKFALKSQQAGVDAVVAEGFEAGGHNGREETTTMVLVPRVRQAVAIPLIAAGGIATGRGMLAAFALGAEGIQMGTRFALSEESSASDAFKKLCIGLQEGDTMLALKKLSPTRLIRNDFFRAVETAHRVGFGCLNADLIAGLPGDTQESFDRSLSDVLESGFENITVHTLSIKNASPIRFSDESVYDAEGIFARACVDYAYKRLCGEGYAPYYFYRQKNTVGNAENTGYSIIGAEGIYNILMMEEYASVFACGAGAITKLVSPDKQVIERLAHPKYPFEYLGPNCGLRTGEVRKFYGRYF